MERRSSRPRRAVVKGDRGGRRQLRRPSRGVSRAHRQTVHILIRSDGLAASMSRYLIQRIEETPAIVLRPYTVITALEGGDHLERVRWRDNPDGTCETRAIRHVFAMTGAVPNTRWLQGCVALDAHGFIKTGADLSPEDLPPRVGRWPGLPTSLKRVCPACSRSATSGAAISSVWRRRWGRARLPSPSYIRCSMNRRETAHAPAERDRIPAVFCNPERSAIEHAPSSSRYAARTMSHHCYDDPGRPSSVVCSWPMPTDVTPMP